MDSGHLEEDEEEEEESKGFLEGRAAESTWVNTQQALCLR